MDGGLFTESAKSDHDGMSDEEYKVERKHNKGELAGFGFFFKKINGDMSFV